MSNNIYSDTSITLKENELNQLIKAYNDRIESGLLTEFSFIHFPQKQIINDLLSKKNNTAPAGTILMLCDFFNIPRFFELTETEKKIKELKLYNQNYKSENKSIYEIEKDYKQYLQIKNDELNNKKKENFNINDIQNTIQNNSNKIEQILENTIYKDIFENADFLPNDKKLKYGEGQKKRMEYFTWLRKAKEEMQCFFRLRDILLNLEYYKLTTSKETNESILKEIEEVKNIIFNSESGIHLINTKEYKEKNLELLNVIKERYKYIRKIIKEFKKIQQPTEIKSNEEPAEKKKINKSNRKIKNSVKLIFNSSDIEKIESIIVNNNSEYNINHFKSYQTEIINLLNYVKKKFDETEYSNKDFYEIFNWLDKSGNLKQNISKNQLTNLLNSFEKQIKFKPFIKSVNFTNKKPIRIINFTVN